MQSIGTNLEEESTSPLQALGELLKQNDAERVELAHLLHKDVAGGLVACSSLGEMMRHEMANGADLSNLGRLLSTMDTTLRQSLQLVRDLTEAQFPPVLKAFGLNVALQQLVRGIAEGFAGSLVLHLNGEEPPFEISTRLNLFRLMQALLKHCVRYANTSWIEVTCRSMTDRLEITIDHDGGDGIWLDANDGAALAVIEARCVLLGSRMEVMRHGPGNKSRVSLTAFSSRRASKP